ncbi:hypothetical protein OEZ85_003668 [Tetradesmus obliquus]|uniref:Protein kinase domain-containing protein n=2 Tax=Tetradesmus obliquus TaxID=3088 RepID=A0ABY8UCI4_TETOB|nr:hypothetical protein OEZ85_003668 [Tetradesmus obliquus]
MRASFDEQDLPLLSSDADAGSTDSDMPSAAEIVRAFASMEEATPVGAGLPVEINAMSTLEVIEEVPDERGFIPQDFAIMKLLGRLGMQDAATSQPASGSSTPGRNTPALDAPSILVYAARYISGLPYQGPVTVQLREYLPSARGVAKNELLVQKRLCGALPQEKWQEPVTVQLREYLPSARSIAKNELLVQKRLCGALPQEKWQAAAKEPDSSCPAVRLLGYLEAPPSDEAFELCDNPADTLWLVYKFEGLRPLALALQQMELPEEPTGLSSMFMKKEQAVALALRSRRTLLQRIAQGLLQALSYCHSRGVAHCGLGPGCVVVNTVKDKEADRLLVKLDNFGLARLYDHPLEDLSDGDDSSSSSSSSSGAPRQNIEDTDGLLQRQQDLQAAGLLLAEVFMVGAAAAGSEVLEVPALKRLLFDVFHEDIGLFKEYCLQDEDNFGGFVEFMDERDGSGWELLGQLLKGSQPAGQLLRTARFFLPAISDVAVE